MLPEKLKKAQKYGEKDFYVPIDKDEMIMELMEIDGVLDINESNEPDEGIIIDVITAKKSFAQVDSIIRNLGYHIFSSELAKISKNRKEINKDKLDSVINFINKLEEHEDVDSVWSDI